MDYSMKTALVLLIVSHPAICQFRGDNLCSTADYQSCVSKIFSQMFQNVDQYHMHGPPIRKLSKICRLIKFEMDEVSECLTIPNECNEQLLEKLDEEIPKKLNFSIHQCDEEASQLCTDPQLNDDEVILDGCIRDFSLEILDPDQYSELKQLSNHDRNARLCQILKEFEKCIEELKCLTELQKFTLIHEVEDDLSDAVQDSQGSKFSGEKCYESTSRNHQGSTSSSPLFLASIVPLNLILKLTFYL